MQFFVSAQSQSSLSQEKGGTGGRENSVPKKRRLSALVLMYKKTLKLNRAPGTVHGANFVSFYFSYTNDRLPRTMYDRVIAV